MLRRCLLLCFLSVFPAAAQPVLWTGTFTNATWFNDWVNAGAPKMGIPFGSNNITRIVDTSAPGGSYLRITYPAGSYAPSGAPPAPVGGTQFYGAVLHTNGNSPHDALTLQYSLRFPSNYNFVIGGKLPGLYGGTGNTGTDYPNGTDGFTTRFMWRQDGAGESYPFLPNSPTVYGTSLGRGNWLFTGDNQWHMLRQDVFLNDIGVSNGLIRVFYDGVSVLEAPGLYFRTVANLQIDGVLFQTFFGGGDTSYATPVTTYADFANFIVSELVETGSLSGLSNYQAIISAQNPNTCFRFDNSLADSVVPTIAVSAIGSGGYANDYFNNPDRSRFFTATGDALTVTNDLFAGGGASSSSASGKGSLTFLFRSLDGTNNTGQRFLFSQGNTTANGNAFGLFFENDTSASPNSLKLRTGNTTTTILPPDQILLDRWYYFAVTWDETRNAGEVKWWLGPLGGSMLTGTVNSTDTSVIGDNGTVYVGNNSGLNNAFRNPGIGRIDEFAIWNRELSGTEITNQFNSVIVQTPPPPQLSISLSSTNVLISWPTNSTPGLLLESNAFLTSSNWSFVGAASVVGTQFVVSNSLSGSTRFYRLNNP